MNDNYIYKIQSFWRGYTIRSQLWYMNRFDGTHVVGDCVFTNKSYKGRSPIYNHLTHVTTPV